MTRTNHTVSALEAKAEASLKDSISWTLVGLTQAESADFTSQLSDAIGGLEYEEGKSPLVDYFFGLHCQHQGLTRAIYAARMHVLRQLQGRHEQDRVDAAEWLEKWGDQTPPES